MAKSALQLNVRNWIGDTRNLSLAARGLLVELLCHMRREPDLEIPAGPTGRLTTEELSILVSAKTSDVEAAFAELLASGLVDHTLTGCITSKLNRLRKPTQSYLSPTLAKTYTECAVKIYDMWPRPGSRQESLAAVIRLLASKVLTPEDLYVRAMRYRDANLNKEPKYVKKLCRWINQSMWEEEAEADERTGSASSDFNDMWDKAVKP